MYKIVFVFVCFLFGCANSKTKLAEEIPVGRCKVYEINDCKTSVDINEIINQISGFKRTHSAFKYANSCEILLTDTITNQKYKIIYISKDLVIYNNEFYSK